jgi:undecaprenyl-diphosphatase
MTNLEALFLGIVQGLTEFLPISSSGHLLLAQNILGLSNPRDYLLFDLVCHLGTLVAIVVYYFRQLIALLSNDRRTLRNLILATLPLFAVAGLLPLIENIYGSPIWLGCAFIITALLLYTSGRCQQKEEPPPRRWHSSIIVGCFQAVAVLPGISRSGATISAARLLGWSASEAVSFSFLLAIPAILGGLALETLKLFHQSHVPAMEFGWMPYAVGFVSSFIVGCLAIAIATKLVMRNAMAYFAWYCLAMGLFCLIYFAWR